MAVKTLLTEKDINIILNRLACQLIENHTDFKNTVIIGLQPRGVYFADRLINMLETDYKIDHLTYGQLDITFYRDDFRRRDYPIQANKTHIDFIVEDKHVVIIDDVLFSGRSINAALTALQAFGRPTSVELMVLIDRRFSRHLPIQPNYKGRQVDVINSERVQVRWRENDKKDSVIIMDNSK